MRKFRFARRKSGDGHAAIVSECEAWIPFHLPDMIPTVKINKKTLEMEEEDRFDSITLEDLAEGSSNTQVHFLLNAY